MKHNRKISVKAQKKLFGHFNNFRQFLIQKNTICVRAQSHMSVYLIVSFRSFALYNLYHFRKTRNTYSSSVVVQRCRCHLHRHRHRHQRHYYSTLCSVSESQFGDCHAIICKLFATISNYRDFCQHFN